MFCRESKFLHRLPRANATPACELALFFFVGVVFVLTVFAACTTARSARRLLLLLVSVLASASEFARLLFAALLVRPLLVRPPVVPLSLVPLPVVPPLAALLPTFSPEETLALLAASAECPTTACLAVPVRLVDAVADRAQ